MKVVLLGYMGSGKSTISKYVANLLMLPVLDLDNYIEEREKKTISEIFESKGEIYFRKKEHEYLKELLASKDPFVLALGGGTPCYAGNMNHIIENENTTAVYLQLNLNTLVSRLENQKEKRPLIAQLEKEKLQEFIAKHLFERRSFYEQANIIVKADKKSVKEITEEIVSLLN